MIKNKAQVFFVLIVILLLITVALAIMFGGVLYSETITQKWKLETIKADGLQMSAVNLAVKELISNSQFQLPTTTVSGISSGSVVYSVKRITPTTTRINAKATFGKIIKDSQTVVVFSASSTTSTIISINVNYN